MNDIIKTGKYRTILISISILLVSLHTIFFYNSVFKEVENKKIIQQSVRFILTIGLLVMVYKGKNWARVISIILFSIAVIGAVVGIVSIEKDLLVKTPLFVMTFVYSMAIYHFGFSQSFKAFVSSQNDQIN